MKIELLPHIGQVQTITVDGLQIRIARNPGGSELPVLLFSPWPESIYGFRDLIPRLAHVAPTLAIDLPGFGGSETRLDLMSPSAMGEFIWQLTQQLEIRRIHAIGPDIATLALLFTASRHPSLFESLVLGSGGTSLDLVGSGLDDLIQSPANAFESMEGGDLAIGFIKQAAARPIPAAVLDDYRKSSAGRRFEEATNFVRAYRRDLPILATLLPSITAPCLIISSTNDNMVPPSNGDFLVKHLSRSTHKVLPGGHLIWEDAAIEYGDLALEWLTGAYRSIGTM